MKLQLNGNALKIIAMISMFIDHLGLIFFPTMNVFRIIGRISFPIYAYLISEGCKYTHDRKKYFLQIFILGLVSSAGISYVLEEVSFCVLITFSISILLIYLIDYVRKSFGKRVLLLVLSLIAIRYLCTYIDLDYGFCGILVPVMVYLANDRKFKIAMFSVSLVFLSVSVGFSHEIYCLISVLFIMLYNGERGKLNLKWFFYVFYPMHLLLLEAINILIS